MSSRHLHRRSEEPAPRGPVTRLGRPPLRLATPLGGSRMRRGEAAKVTDVKDDSPRLDSWWHTCESGGMFWVFMLM